MRIVVWVVQVKGREQERFWLLADIGDNAFICSTEEGEGVCKFLFREEFEEFAFSVDNALFLRDLRLRYGVSRCRLSRLPFSNVLLFDVLRLPLGRPFFWRHSGLVLSEFSGHLLRFAILC